MWAIGADSVAPDDILVRYNGTSWQQVTSTALAGLQFGSILALSDSNVWVTAAVGGGRLQHLLHFDGHSWTSLPVPSGVQLRAVAPDGHGGLWFSAERSTSQAPIAEHRSGTGTWSSHPLPSGAGQAFGIAPIPGTTSLWASGYLDTNGGTGSDAVVWGYGPAA
jgi:streptogramin lyase